MSKWLAHKIRWKDCTKCELCETRKSIVLFKGKIPCDILFVGEAPGVSEDLLGKPFVGPAGHLLNQIISSAELDSYRLGFTNVVACIPLDPDGDKVHDPHKLHVKACSERLNEIIEIANPNYIVAVGKVADKYLKQKKLHENYEYVTITHPGAILRMDVTQKGLQYQRAVIALNDLMD